jgi:hypothetical protein
VDSRSQRTGIAGAVLCAVALGALWAVSVPAFWPVDELSHVAYARAISEGRLPTIEDPIPAGGVPGIGRRLAFERDARHADRLDIWTANHPPLHPALAALPLGLGRVLGAPGLGFLGARLIAVLAMGLGVALTGVLARLLVPDRPLVPVGAAAFAALVPGVAHIAGLVMNDSLSFALCTLLLVGTTLVVRGDRAHPRAVLAVGAVGAAAALTRVSALPLVALAGAACTLCAWRRAGARAGLRAAALTGGLPVLGAGWFYLRNLRLYGDLTGTAALLRKFDRDPNAELGSVLTSGRYYVDQWDRLLGDLSTGVWTSGWREPAGRVVGAVLLAGLVVAAVGWLRRRPLALPREAGAWVVPLGFLLALVLASAQFHARGGSAHARYLVSALAVLAVVAAVAVGRLGGRASGRWLLLGVLLGLAVLNLGAWVEFLDLGDRVWVEDDRPYPLLLVGGRWASTAAAVALLALVAGMGLVTRALLQGAAATSATGDVQHRPARERA